MHKSNLLRAYTPGHYATSAVAGVAEGIRVLGEEAEICLYRLTEMSARLVFHEPNLFHFGCLFPALLPKSEGKLSKTFMALRGAIPPFDPSSALPGRQNLQGHCIFNPPISIFLAPCWSRNLHGKITVGSNLMDNGLELALNHRHVGYHWALTAVVFFFYQTGWGEFLFCSSASFYPRRPRK